MADTYGELISRLCQLRDELNKTLEGRALLDILRRKLDCAAVLERQGHSPEKAWAYARCLRAEEKEDGQ